MKRFISLILVLTLALALCACGAPAQPAAPATPAETPAPAEPTPAAPVETPEPAPAEPVEARVMVLNGTTGFGMAQLMDSAAKGTAALDYTFSVESDASNITAALINGSCDIAALPTNAAAALYNKSGGAVQCLALNTRGVIYLVAGAGETVTSLADLEGKTVYAPAQNPTFLFSALCEKAGVNVTVDNTYAQPADLRTAVAADVVSLAVLPEPMVTIACSANETLSVALDLTAEWDKVFPEGSLVQGCIVVRREFAEANAAALADFLDEYAASVAFLSEDIDAAAQMIVDAGIFSAAPVAKKAIPKCNVCCLTGDEMQSAMDAFLTIMVEVAPASVGGAMPAEDFYCFPG